MKNHIKEILFALCDGGVEYVVGGGVAAVLHGVERVTMDIDIAVNLTSENLERLVQVTKSLGLKPRVPVPLEALGDPEAIRMMVEEKHAMVFSLIDPSDPLRYLDVFLKEELSFPVLTADAELIQVEGRMITVVSARRLLAIKKAIIPPRPKDQIDIVELERIIDERS
jgi:hypothetical protein